MLTLEGALRDIQDATASLDELTAARDADTYRRAFNQCVSHIRSAQWKIQTAVKTAARQEPGRPRAEAAAAWWAAQATIIDNDPLLSWARDARDHAIHDVSTARPTTHGSPTGVHVPRLSKGPLPEVTTGGARIVENEGAPTVHLGLPIPVEQQTTAGLLSMCIAHCGDVYDRAMRAS